MKPLLKTLRIAFRLAWDDMRANPGRSVIIALSLFSGIASVLITLGVLRAMNLEVQKQLEYNGGLKMIYYEITKPRNAREKVRFGMSPGLLPAQVERMEREIPGLEFAIPRAYFHADASYGNASYSVVDNAAGFHYQETYMSRILKEGRFITEKEMEQAANVCIIDSALASKFFRKSRWLGKKIALNKVPLEVVGVIANDQYEDIVFYPIPVYWKNFASRSTPLKKCDFRCKREEDVLKVKAEMEALLLQQHRGVRDFELGSMVELLKESEGQRRMAKIVMVGVGLIALLLGIVGIVNVFLSLINDRVRDIGMLKAIGSSNADIFLQHIIESLLLSLVGGGLGLWGGALLSKSSLLPWPGLLVQSDYLMAMGTACLAGVIAGLIPAWVASRLSPAKAIGWQ
ncbi:MAG: ABC transporter permease [Fibrobacterota bacterium]